MPRTHERIEKLLREQMNMYAKMGPFNKGVIRGLAIAKEIFFGEDPVAPTMLKVRAEFKTNGVGVDILLSVESPLTDEKCARIRKNIKEIYAIKNFPVDNDEIRLIQLIKE